FFEVKNFIATQAMDEARHAEIFRKRALSTGWGLMRASSHNEFNLKFLRDADSFAEASLALHLQAEGMVLTLFRFSEYISPTEGDKRAPACGGCSSCRSSRWDSRHNDVEADRESGHAARGGSRAGAELGASEARRARSARALDGPPEVVAYYAKKDFFEDDELI